jgi:hypothetical protein
MCVRMCVRACVNMRASVRVRACAIVRSRWRDPPAPHPFEDRRRAALGGKVDRRAQASTHRYSRVPTGTHGTHGCSRVLAGTHGCFTGTHGTHGCSRVLTGTHRCRRMLMRGQVDRRRRRCSSRQRATDNSNATERMQHATCNLQHAALRLTPQRALRRPAGALPPGISTRARGIQHPTAGDNTPRRGRT